MIIGLTGGIATGKSESAKYFNELGIFSIDADAISKELTTSGMPAFNELVQAFGRSVLCSNEFLNRKKLANIIFSNKQAKSKVEKILHKRIISCINEMILYNRNKHDVLINAPLLFEVGLDKICDKIIVIWVPYDIQVKRLMLRDNLDNAAAKKRIHSQMPLKEKIKFANFVIDNTGSKEDLKKNINNLYKTCINISEQDLCNK
ncbi:MAG: dephospho-CoA kinase [Endomicrobium sp.]|jgi:dephospho-CoA kinase|nr:dephospho-CoA kinase [Endomicrobium sp.]